MSSCRFARLHWFCLDELSGCSPSSTGLCHCPQTCGKGSSQVFEASKVDPFLMSCFKCHKMSMDLTCPKNFRPNVSFLSNGIYTHCVLLLWVQITDWVSAATDRKMSVECLEGRKDRLCSCDVIKSHSDGSDAMLRTAKMLWCVDWHKLVDF